MDGVDTNILEITMIGSNIDLARRRINEVTGLDDNDYNVELLMERPRLEYA